MRTGQVSVQILAAAHVLLLLLLAVELLARCVERIYWMIAETFVGKRAHMPIVWFSSHSSRRSGGEHGSA